MHRILYRRLGALMGGIGGRIRGFLALSQDGTPILLSQSTDEPLLYRK